MHGLDSVFENDVGGNCITIGMLITHLPSDARTFRLRTWYYATTDRLLAKRHFIPIRQENSSRKRLVDILAEWVDQQHVSVPALGSSP